MADDHGVRMKGPAIYGPYNAKPKDVDSIVGKVCLGIAVLLAVSVALGWI